MAIPKLTDKKLLSVFASRFLPTWWQEKYPRFVEFFTQVLEWMESDNRVYDNITNYSKYVDLDLIATLKASSNPTEVELGNKLIDQIYNQFLGDAKARYLSTLMDETLYIKNQKTVLAYKGTAYSFLFVFLLILGGYFRISTLFGYEKKHDGVFQYNGVMSYGNGSTWVEPYVYLIKSEFVPSVYQKIVSVLNPAGMLALTFLQKTASTSSNYTIESANSFANRYMAFYKDDTFIGMVEMTGQLALASTSNDYDIELQDYTFWKFKELVETGVKNIYYECNFNTSNLMGEFNNVRVWTNVTVDYVLATAFFYTSNITPTGYTDVAGPIDLLKQTGDENFYVVDNTSVGVMVEFA